MRLNTDTVVFTEGISHDEELTPQTSEESGEKAMGQKEILYTSDIHPDASVQRYHSEMIVRVIVQITSSLSGHHGF